MFSNAQKLFSKVPETIKEKGKDISWSWNNVYKPRVKEYVTPQGIMGKNVAELGQVGTKIAQEMDYGDKQNAFMKQAVPRFLEASTQAPGAAVAGATHHLFNPIKDVDRQYKTTGATNFLSSMYGFGKGVGSLYYKPVEGVVENVTGRALSNMLSNKLSQSLAKGAGKVGASVASEMASSLPVAAIESKMTGEPFSKTYPTNVAWGLGARATLGTLNKGAKAASDFMSFGSPGQVDPKALRDQIDFLKNSNEYKVAEQQSDIMGRDIAFQQYPVLQQLRQLEDQLRQSQFSDAVSEWRFNPETGQPEYIGSQAGFMNPRAKINPGSRLLRTNLNTINDEDRKFMEAFVDYSKRNPGGELSQTENAQVGKLMELFDIDPNATNKSVGSMFQRILEADDSIKGQSGAIDFNAKVGRGAQPTKGDYKQFNPQGQAAFRAEDSTNKGSTLGKGTYFDFNKKFASTFGKKVGNYNLSPNAKMMDLRGQDTLQAFTDDAISKNQELFRKTMQSRGNDEAIGAVMRKHAQDLGFDGIVSDTLGSVVWDKKLLKKIK